MLAEHITLPEEGERLGPYRLGARLSVSILGAFFAATETASGRPVLLHVLSRALTKADARFEGRYREAVQRLSQLPECAILPVDQVLWLGDYLVVLYAEGELISVEREVLNRSVEVSEAEAGEWLRKVAAGLGLAAECGIGHYFLTPAFLFLDRRGAIRVAGAGLFQSIQYNQFESFVSGAILPIRDREEEAFSAIEILSPEIRNYKARDRRSDFYCLGMCAYFFITKRKPVRKWVLPVTSRPGIDPEWNLLISRCLEPSPSARFADFAEFEAALDAMQRPVAEAAAAPERKRRRLLHTLPTPGRLWGKPLRILRLVMLGVAGLMALGTASMLLEILLYEEEEEPIGRPVRLADPDSANLVVTSARPGTRLSISGPSTGYFEVGPDEALFLKAYPGGHSLRAVAAGNFTGFLEVEVPRDGRVTVEVEPQLETAAVTFKAAPGTRVEAVFEGFPDLYIGTVGDSGQLEAGARFIAGVYRFSGRHSAHAEALTEAVTLPRQEPIEWAQRLLPTRLQVHSEPSGARVRVGDALLGETPLEDVAWPLEEPVELVLELEAYHSVRQRIEPRPGELLDLGTVELRPFEVEIWLQLRTVEGLQAPDWSSCEVQLNGKAVPALADGRIRARVGDLELRVVHPAFFPGQKTLTVGEAGFAEPIDIYLEPLPAGIVPVLPPSVKARFRVDGEAAALDASGTLLIEPGRSVMVEAIVENYYSVTQLFEEKQRARVEWVVPLKPLPGPEPGQPFNPPYFDLPMVWVEPDRFTMGSPVTEYRRLPNEDNRTVVRFQEGFWVGVKEVQQSLWQRIMGDNPSAFKGPDHPVDSVSWSRASEFCERLSSFERAAGRLPAGFVYRLPTEAEWEYVARAGSSAPFSFGSVASPKMGNFSGHYDPESASADAGPDHYGTLPGGSFSPNAWGLFDVHGNVAEWTLDRYWDRLPGGAVTDPVNMARGRGHSIRGGGWSSPAHLCRSSARDSLLAESSRDWVGFRVVLARERIP